MKKYSIEARELLSETELYEIKAGGDDDMGATRDPPTCGVICATCIGCVSCMACSTRYLDVIVVP